MKKVKSALRKIKRAIAYRKEKYSIGRQTGRKCELSINDLLCCYAPHGELLRYDIVVRYLTVEGFHKGSDDAFEMYRMMQNKRVGPGAGDAAVEQFKALIRSYNEKGYDKESRIVLDRNLGLIDGSHRIALALHYGYQNVSALIVNTVHPVSYSIDWFVQNGFSDEQLALIIQTGRMLLQRAMVPFSCVIWSPAVALSDRIIKDLSYFGRVEQVQRFRYRPEEYKNVVRAIYAIDDIEKWKIEKKLEYMEGHGSELVSVDLTMPNPIYRIKGKTGLPLSTVGERIKKALRSKYQGEIENYFFDIILHMGDNLYQSAYMRHVISEDIGFPEAIAILNRYNYALIKTDVPNMPENYPERIPVGKDIDLVCSKDDAPALIEELEAWCHRFKDYTIVKIEEDRHVRIRIQWGKSLIYQLDISVVLAGIGEGFVQEALSSRVFTGSYYVLDPQYEYICRMWAYHKNKSKTHHRDYLIAHRSDYNAELAKRFYDIGLE